MANSNLTIRVDKKVRKEAESLFGDFGLTMSSAINMFLKQAIRERRIPFEIRKEIPNRATIEAIEEVENIENGKIKTKTYKNKEELMKDLLK